MFPFDSKVLAPRRGIMHIDRFASHHGWYSGWSESRQGGTAKQTAMFFSGLQMSGKESAQ